MFFISRDVAYYILSWCYITCYGKKDSRCIIIISSVTMARMSYPLFLAIMQLFSSENYIRCRSTMFCPLRKAWDHVLHYFKINMLMIIASLAVISNNNQISHWDRNSCLLALVMNYCLNDWCTYDITVFKLI